jgi:hypothetical protein
MLEAAVVAGAFEPVAGPGRPTPTSRALSGAFSWNTFIPSPGFAGWRVGSCEVNATFRPPGEIAGWVLHHQPASRIGRTHTSSPPELTLTRRVVRARRARTKMSCWWLLSSGTRVLGRYEVLGRRRGSDAASLRGQARRGPRVEGRGEPALRNDNRRRLITRVHRSGGTPISALAESQRGQPVPRSTSTNSPTVTVRTSTSSRLASTSVASASPGPG